MVIYGLYISKKINDNNFAPGFMTWHDKVEIYHPWMKQFVIKNKKKKMSKKNVKIK